MRDFDVVLAQSMVILSKDLLRSRVELMQNMQELRTSYLNFVEPTSIKEAYYDKTNIWWGDDD